MSDMYLVPFVEQGWAAVATDGGHNGTIHEDASWALNQDGTVAWNLLNNFASRSLVEEIIIGKAMTEQYCGKAPYRAYWYGCSTGGRQDHAIAQSYPHLVDGILAISPAISMAHLVTAGFWPQLAMQHYQTFISNCELDYSADFLQEPEHYDFDPDDLANLEDERNFFQCEERKAEFTPEMAHVVKTFHKGPGWVSDKAIFTGLAYGVDMTTLAKITTSDEGHRSQRPYPAVASWLKNLVLKEPDYDLSNVDMDDYAELYGQAVYEFGGLLDSDSPDLSASRDINTKLLSWHGIDDELIPFQNTFNYRMKVEGVMGGAEEVDTYYRLFLAPGVQHCSGGNGPAPANPLDALVQWVEQGKPLTMLQAKTTDRYTDEEVLRNLCLWPKKQRYLSGNPDLASSWTCVNETQRSSVRNKSFAIDISEQVLGGVMSPQAGLNSF